MVQCESADWMLSFADRKSNDYSAIGCQQTITSLIHITCAAAKPWKWQLQKALMPFEWCFSVNMQNLHLTYFDIGCVVSRSRFGKVRLTAL